MVSALCSSFAREQIVSDVTWIVRGRFRKRTHLLQQYQTKQPFLAPMAPAGAGSAPSAGTRGGAAWRRSRPLSSFVCC